MQDYEILKINNEYKYMVLSTSYVNPIDLLYDIESFMESENMKMLN